MTERPPFDDYFSWDPEETSLARVWHEALVTASFAKICRDERWTFDISDSHARFHFWNGAGDEMIAYFSPQGAVIRGFDHCAESSPYATDERHIDEIFAGLPAAFHELLNDKKALGGMNCDPFPAKLGDKDVAVEATTFCFWWDAAKSEWIKGGDYDGGSDFLVEGACGDSISVPEGSCGEAQGKLSAGGPLTADDIKAIDPKAEVADVQAFLAKIGLGKAYPFA